MNELNQALERNLNKLAALKSDLQGVEDLLEEKPIDAANIVATMEQRDTQVEELKSLLPNLKTFET